MKGRSRRAPDAVLLGIWTVVCIALIITLNRYYMPSVGTPWEVATAVELLATIVAVGLWMIFAGVFIRTHLWPWD